mgnify:CR=1 FL=1
MSRVEFFETWGRYRVGSIPDFLLLLPGFNEAYRSVNPVRVNHARYLRYNMSADSQMRTFTKDWDAPLFPEQGSQTEVTEMADRLDRETDEDCRGNK